MKLMLQPFMMETWFDADPRPVLDLISLADRKGFDGVALPEHILMSKENLDNYPYADETAGPRWFDENTPFYETISYLSAIAAVTKNMTLSTGVLLAPLRSASLLAKQLATLDHLSGGRVAIGYGVGWLEVDYTAEGLNFKTRFSRMVEIAEACKVIWTEAPASYHGKHVNFDNVYAKPFPVQEGGIPQWFGLGATDINIERIARVADGWCPLAVPLDEVKVGLARIKARMEELGRDTSNFPVVLNLVPINVDGVPNLEATLADIPRYVEAGATWVQIAALNFCAGPDDFEGFVDACIVARDKHSA
ncbi:TIGR03619 family F420-dependent LLM class oxidoreductase [soil metagenome]